MSVQEGTQVMKEMLQITAREYVNGTARWQQQKRDYPNLRLGQFLVNEYGKEDRSYTELFYAKDNEVNRYIEIVSPE